MNTFILPGMGASSKMYSEPHYNNLINVKFLNWPKYKGEETINDIAKSVIAEYQIEFSDIVGGSSLGGIVALEIAKILNLKKALLIGSTNDPIMINKFLKAFGKLADYTPINLVQFLTGKSNNDLLNMFAESDSNFIKAMCKALHRWQNPIIIEGQIYQIHGQHDHVIKPPINNATIIQDGGHLISITHPNEVACFINEHSH